MYFHCIMDLNVIVLMFTQYGTDLLSLWIRNPHKFKVFSGKLSSVSVKTDIFTIDLHVQAWQAGCVDV